MNAWEVVRHVNGRPWSRLHIGWFVVAEARDFDQYGEYAADYWTATVPAGRYPLCMVHVDLRAYGVAASKLAGEPSAVELLPEVEAREVHYVYDGKPGLTHGLFVNGEEV